MTKNTYIQVNDITFSHNIQLVLPLNFEVLVPKDDSVRLLSQIVDEMNLRSLNLTYSSKGRNPAISPRIMFKIMAYAYMEGIYSSRAIAKACSRDVNFMWLLENCLPPEHSTINRFRKEHLSGCIQELFSQLVWKLHELGEVAFKNLFIDGTKIEANANKYTFVWEKTVSKNNEKLKEKIIKFCRRINDTYRSSFCSENENQIEQLQEITEFLLAVKATTNVDFVAGKGKHKTQLQRDCEEALSYLERKENYENHFCQFKGRNNYCKTDHDATFMHMKEDHMRNAQLKPGYNLQIGVEGGYVLFAEAFSDRNDVLTLIPFLNHFRETFAGTVIPNIVADAGYESEENYDYLKNNIQTAYIKPQTYEQWKKRSFKKIISKRENMQYDAQLDEYTCSQKRKLKVVSVYNQKKRKNIAYPYEPQITVYECEDCTDCPVKDKCTKAKGNRTLSVSKKFLEYRDESLKNILSSEGILLRINRSIQAEGAFGAIKEDAGFRRFYTRGKANILTEFLLLCFGLNINKLHKKILNSSMGQLLHCENKVA